MKTDDKLSSSVAKQKNTKEFHQAAALANKLIPFIAKNGLMTPLGADVRLSYMEGLPKHFQLGERVFSDWRHEVLIELRTFGGMVASTPIGDLSLNRLGLESLMMFGENCTLRIIIDGDCCSRLLWTRDSAWACHHEGRWVTEVLKAIGPGRRADVH